MQRSKEIFQKRGPRRFLLYTATLVALLRFSVSLIDYFRQGSLSFWPPLSGFVVAQVWQVAEIFLPAVLLLPLSPHRNARKIAVLFFSIFCLMIAIWSIADPIIFSLAGDHLTLSLLAHFAGFDIFQSDYLIKPILANLHIVLPGIIMIALLLFLFRKLVLNCMRDSFLVSERNGLAISAGLMLLLSPPMFSGTFEYALTPGGEFIADAFSDWRQHISVEKITQLRNFVDPDGKAQWLNQEYPLVCRKNAEVDVTKRPPPDIILVVIESLRASDLFHITGNGMRMRSLEQLASQGVLYPRFISSGFPSVEGFIALHAGVWPHSRRRTGISFQKTHLDGLAPRMIRLGYTPLIAGEKTDFDAEGYWLSYFYENSTTKTDIYPSEKNIVDSMITSIAAADNSPAKPLYAYLKTYNPHYPYETPVYGKNEATSGNDTAQNYKQSLTYVDRELGRLFRFLRSRHRWQNTLIFVTGDHANILRTTDASAMPGNDYVWTSAILAGGALHESNHARRDERPAGQPDIKATILQAVGDTSPRVCLGQDLLAPVSPRHFALAIRPGGVRYETIGGAFLLDRRYAGHWHPLGKPGQTPKISPDTILSLTRTWSQLIETNRVWNPEILKNCANLRCNAR
jgi:hypothetical protein